MQALFMSYEPRPLLQMISLTVALLANPEFFPEM